MKKRIDGIYLIKNNITMNVRIGSAKDVPKRFSNYKARLRAGDGNKLMQQDFNEYGEQSFEFILLETCLVKDLYAREKYYLEEIYDDCKYYNKNAVLNLEKKIRRGKESANYKAKRSAVTSGESNGHCTKLSETSIFEILDMLDSGVNRELVASKYDISANYTYSFGKTRWVNEYNIWTKQKGTIAIEVVTVPSASDTLKSTQA